VWISPVPGYLLQWSLFSWHLLCTCYHIHIQSGGILPSDHPEFFRVEFTPATCNKPVQATYPWLVLKKVFLNPFVGWASPFPAEKKCLQFLCTPCSILSCSHMCTCTWVKDPWFRAWFTYDTVTLLCRSSPQACLKICQTCWRISSFET